MKLSVTKADKTREQWLEYRRIWYKLKKFNMPGTGDPTLDSKLRHLFGDWLTQEPDLFSKTLNPKGL